MEKWQFDRHCKQMQQELEWQLYKEGLDPQEIEEDVALWRLFSTLTGNQFSGEMWGYERKS